MSKLSLVLAIIFVFLVVISILFILEVSFSSYSIKINSIIITFNSNGVKDVTLAFIGTIKNGMLPNNYTILLIAELTQTKIIPNTSSTHASKSIEAVTNYIGNETYVAVGPLKSKNFTIYLTIPANELSENMSVTLTKLDFSISGLYGYHKHEINFTLTQIIDQKLLSLLYEIPKEPLSISASLESSGSLLYTLNPYAKSPAFMIAFQREGLVYFFTNNTAKLIWNMNIYRVFPSQDTIYLPYGDHNISIKVGNYTMNYHVNVNPRQSNYTVTYMLPINVTSFSVYIYQNSTAYYYIYLSS
ncbi:MAG: hypothetical protein JZD40_04970 [Sulfolobus sp.]|nr:hypothetical protein [Sulfolobus sp.]